MARGLLERYDPNNLRLALVKYRNRANLSQADAVDMSGLTKSTLNRTENGATMEPKFATVAALAYLYDVSLDTLAGEVGIPTHRVRGRKDGAVLDIAEPKMAAALDTYARSTNTEWKRHLADTVWALVSAYAATHPEDFPQE